MSAQTAAHIFLKEWGLIFENETTRTVHISLEQASVTSALQEVSEITLAPGVSTILAPGDAVLWLLPVVGNLLVEAKGISLPLNCGELGHIPAASPVVIRNPYETELVRFICLRLRTKANAPDMHYQRYAFDLQAHLDQCIPIIASLTGCAHIGQFTMRAATEYIPQQKDACMFSYVLQGSMEIEERLLHAGDALYTWNTCCMELESFGTESIVLIVELPLLETK